MTGSELTFFSPCRPFLRPRDRNDWREVGKGRMCLRHEGSLSTYEFAEESDVTQRLFDSRRDQPEPPLHAQQAPRGAVQQGSCSR